MAYRSRPGQAKGEGGKGAPCVVVEVQEDPELVGARKGQGVDVFTHLMEGRVQRSGRERPPPRILRWTQAWPGRDESIGREWLAGCGWEYAPISDGDSEGKINRLLSRGREADNFRVGGDLVT